ncbi:stage II sporulation protein M [Niveibacterium sp. 24ML]|uniref:stage II sporulation protein M n=1 Tax=Niveibacterium sp. 24ML TaxID=2985512 RepID=UPI00226FEF1F|nr:stage II sporulation protein M [Niveibacterium sp. 24ML]MCX9154747.1 stage II sporulation protein M [Niveibacterium sp. 24ML]
MRQEQFEARFAARWDEFDLWLKHTRLPRRQRAKQATPFADVEMAPRYREICQQLALARSRDYGPAVTERLHRLALEGHDALYGTPGGGLSRFFAYLAGGFAQEVRREWRVLLAATLAFVLPYVLTMIAVRAQPDFAYIVLPADQLAQFDTMYGPDADALGTQRGARDDLTMFGFYIYNNIGLAFKTFAGGLLAGLGSLAALLYNGTFMGTIEAHVVNLGHAARFYSFVAGHSSFELTAIVLCGAAGLKLGLALLAPGDHSRSAALRQAARSVIGIVAGAAAMLVIAAAIEGFWSPRTLPLPLKLGVGAFNWVLVIGYLLFAGRRNAP